MTKDIYDLPPAAFGKRIGLDIKGQHIATEALLDPAIDAYWEKRPEPTQDAA
jgi:hypothetical protein